MDCIWGHSIYEKGHFLPFMKYATFFMLSTTLVFRESSNLMILLHEYYTLSHEEDKKKIPWPVTMKQAGYGLLNSKEKSQRVLSPL